MTMVQRLDNKPFIGEFISKEKCIYQKCYCEENVRILCDNFIEFKDSILYSLVIFVSNLNKCTPHWHQDPDNPDKVILWDYHVFWIVINKKKEAFVYDLGSTLPFPCPFMKYFNETFHPKEDFPSKFKQRFRVVLAKDYNRLFASDRSHMKQNDKWIAPPPSYPPFSTTNEKMNLFSWINVQSDYKNGNTSLDNLKDMGSTFNLQEFEYLFNNKNE